MGSFLLFFSLASLVASLIFVGWEVFKAYRDIKKNKKDE